MNVDDKGNPTRSKTREKYFEEEVKSIQNNAKAKKISACRDAINIWDALQTSHDATSQFKQSKIDMLTWQHKIFRMRVGETIQQMYIRLTLIINELISLGEVIPRNKIVRDILIYCLLPGIARSMQYCSKEYAYNVCK